MMTDKIDELIVVWKDYLSYHKGMYDATKDSIPNTFKDTQHIESYGWITAIEKFLVDLKQLKGK